MHCPYEENRHTEGDMSEVKCLVLCVACGFVMSFKDLISNTWSTCEHCISNEAWNDANVPQLKPEDEARTPPEADAMALVQESPFFKSLYIGFLRARLMGGDCPLYQGPNPIDLSATFTKYRTATDDREAEDLLAEMLDRWLGKAKAGVNGVHPENVARDKIATLAEDNGFLTPTEADELRG